MDKEIGILHISDVHICKNNAEKISELVTLLKADIDNLQKDNQIQVELLCVTGDLINSGDNSNEELDMVMERLLTPLMEFLNIPEEHVYIVPGNHEVKRSAISQVFETGLKTMLTSEESINKFIEEIDSNPIRRIEYFDNDFSTLYGGEPVLRTPLTRAYLTSIGETQFGISCINSAWRSTGIGDAERGAMIVGSKQISASINAIQTADIKICLLHHPLDWLTEVDRIAIEKCVNQYDVVLNGHIHESYTKQYTSFNGQTLFNTCGKFDNSNDIFNGYSLISINPYNKKSRVFLRHYFGYPRNCYDKAIELAEDGMFYADLGDKDDNLALAYNIIHSIKQAFTDYANSYFVSNVIAGKSVRSFDDSFIRPELSRHSEYEKEMFDSGKMDEDEKVSLEYLCSTSKNVLLLGKKEIGKTTVLHFLTKTILGDFNTFKSVPIIIDARLVDFAGKEPMLRASKKFIDEYCADKESFSLEGIRNLLANGLCTIIIDNFETLHADQLEKVDRFITSYADNKFILSETEFVNARSLRAVKNTPSCEYEEIHICSLSREQIRTVATREISGDDTSSLIDKVMLCFKKTALPKTPFVLSLILSLCDNTEFSPVNEAVVMEQFMESILEKTDPSEAYTNTYDFRNKEDFLICLAVCMDHNNRFYLTNEEFESVLTEYHANVGFSVSDTGFDTLFIHKGVLIRIDGGITFRYNCMIEYYLAKKAEQSSDFLSHILSDCNYLNYSNELMYYTGLNRRDLKTVYEIRGLLRTKFDVIRDYVSDLGEYSIDLELALPEEGLKEKIESGRLTQHESDRLQNTRDYSEDKIPENIDKERQYSDIDSFIQTLFIYGSCLKNLELISRNDKESVFSDYIKGLCVVLSILKRNTEESLEREISKMESLPEKYSDRDIRKEKGLVQDVIKIALPLAIQNMALENIGTSKLSMVMKKSVHDGSNDGFSKLFSVFLLCDLRVPGFKNELKDYVQSLKDRSMLKIVLFKLLYYYQFRYFSSSLDPFLEDILADINLKLNKRGKRLKSYYIQGFKDRRRELTS